MRITTLILPALALIAGIEASPLRNRPQPPRAPRHGARIPREAEESFGSVSTTTTETQSDCEAETAGSSGRTGTSGISSLTAGLSNTQSSTFATSTIVVGSGVADSTGTEASSSSSPISTTNTHPSTTTTGSSASDSETTSATNSPGFETSLHSTLNIPLKGTTTGRPSVIPFQSGTSNTGTDLASLTSGPPNTSVSSSISPTTASASLFVSSTRPSVTGRPLSDIPTVIANPPVSTGAVSPDVYQKNIQEARSFNKLLATLTEQSACRQGQVACVSGAFAECSNDGSWTLTPCSEPNYACLVMPMNSTSGAILGCTDATLAKQVLGSIPDALLSGLPGLTSALSSLLPPTGSSSATASGAPDSTSATGRRTRTVVVTVTTPSSTITVTVDPTATASVQTSDIACTAEPTSVSSAVSTGNGSAGGFTASSFTGSTSGSSFSASTGSEVSSTVTSKSSAETATTPPPSSSGDGIITRTVTVSGPLGTGVFTYTYDLGDTASASFSTTRRPPLFSSDQPLTFITASLDSTTTASVTTAATASETSEGPVTAGTTSVSSFSAASSSKQPPNADPNKSLFTLDPVPSDTVTTTIRITETPTTVTVKMTTQMTTTVVVTALATTSASSTGADTAAATDGDGASLIFSPTTALVAASTSTAETGVEKGVTDNSGNSSFVVNARPNSNSAPGPGDGPAVELVTITRSVTITEKKTETVRETIRETVTETATTTPIAMTTGGVVAR
ncbi:uncharacterized protein C8A04DRAFT_33080 [Dichotomopilus funicola]|uniref:Carbohydrate-binding module family 19 domain-containing protein n=1 Tax=Dichotomopilus funicola TaxID=1934379 RepID=A0AAN6UVQ1_9PEZI|nr:hypothetical protein C8A04DRAFT_33080 [Dichotomopilus funicola]